MDGYCGVKHQLATDIVLFRRRSAAVPSRRLPACLCRQICPLFRSTRRRGITS